METDHDRTARRAGSAAAAAGVLLPVSVAAELLVSAQQPDGTVLRPGLFSFYLGLWIAGTVCLVVALLGLRDLHRSAAARRGMRAPSRPWRVGVGLALGGAVLLGLFAVAVLASALLVGAPFEPAFLLFALGFLLLVLGQATAGIAARRTGVLGRGWMLLVVGAAGALLALAAPADPFHDLGLGVFGAAWAGTGILLVAAGRAGATAHRPPVGTP